MSIPTATKNSAVSAILPDATSLHTDWPGVTGLNEVTGGTPAYARKPVTFGSVTGGQATSTSSLTFDVPAATVRWVGMWKSGAFVGAMPNGGAPSKNFVAMPSTNLIAATAHGYSAGQKVAFFNGTPPGGLTEGVTYFTRDVLPDSFAVASTSGGAAIDLTSGASFGCVMAAITEDVYASQGAAVVSSVVLAVPD